MLYKVVELFTSINGEGQRAGQPAVFVRFQGCNLSCSYCDTSWANEENADYRLLSGKEIRDEILSTGICNVTLTGGEPLLQEHIGELLFLLSKEPSLSIEIETNGSISIEPYLYRNCHFTLDYKLPGSGMESRMDTGSYRFLTMEDTVKFVCSDQKDLECALQIIEKFHLTDLCRVCLSPVFGRIQPKDMVTFLLEHKMNHVNLQLQLHKMIWDPEKRGV